MVVQIFLFGLKRIGKEILMSKICNPCLRQAGEIHDSQFIKWLFQRRVKYLFVV